MTGLTLDRNGNLYAALVSFVPEVQAGIYRISSTGGKATLFAKHPQMQFPNGLAFDEHGNLFVSDSGSGSVFRIDPSGAVEQWASSSLLSGSKDTCETNAGGFDIGANGIVVDRDAIYVDNNDKATLIRIARTSRGQAGVPEVFYGPDCANLGGADGLARDARGDFVVAVNRQNKVVRITHDKKVESVSTDVSLDFPASLVLDAGTVLLTNFALASASAGKPAKPGLVRLGAP
jgi:sugar lactone lactonase YvrE